MTEAELMAIANSHYPDDVIDRHFAGIENATGDSLASYVVRDLMGICNWLPTDEGQLQEAIDRLDTAVRELRGVADGFHEELEQRQASKQPAGSAVPMGMATGDLRRMLGLPEKAAN